MIEKVELLTIGVYSSCIGLRRMVRLKRALSYIACVPLLGRQWLTFSSGAVLLGLKHPWDH